MSIASEILAQLGGNRFVAMTGAKSFGTTGADLSFKLPARFAKDGINFVRITLDASDTYTVRFARVRGITVKDVAEVSGIYNDMLRETFTDATGLLCTMGTLRGA